MPSHALLASMASTAARTVTVVMADCATTSRGSASAQLASVDAGTQQRDCSVIMHKSLVVRFSAQTFVLLLLFFK